MSKIFNISEIINKRLYFGTTNGNILPKSTSKYLYITFDDAFNYPDIVTCFGPADLAVIYRYCEILNTILMNTSPLKIIIQCSSIKNNQKRTNSAFLLGCYATLVLQMSPEEAVRVLSTGNQPPYRTFTDTMSSKSTPSVDLVYYYRGLLKAINKNIFSFNNFNVNEYERLAYQHGFMNWIIPNKFLAFPTPIETSEANGCAIYITYFKKHNIKTVIRLNDALYNSQHFIRNDIDHYDLYFEDCTAPTLQMVIEFLKICEKTPAAVAVHCKAGLGRTGTMIAAYLIKHYKFKALEAIGYIRICRPGSIVCTQQAFLEENEKFLAKKSTSDVNLEKGTIKAVRPSRIIKKIALHHRSK